MIKPILFISHITEEKGLAQELKMFLEENFSNHLEVFVSSNEYSIELGQDWLDKITSSLKICFLELILCSSRSVKRPWINFEAGAGWARKDLNTIPMCHSGMSPEKLPLPLSLLQGMSCTSMSDLQKLITLISNKLKVPMPDVNFQEFISKVISFQESYTYWNEINDNMDKFLDIMMTYSFFQQGEEGNFAFSNTLGCLIFLSKFMDKIHMLYMEEVHFKLDLKPLLEKFPIMQIEHRGISLSVDKTMMSFKMKKTEFFDKIIHDPKFKYYNSINNISCGS